MKFFLSFLVVAVIILAALVQFVAVPKAEGIIQNQLKEFGFKHTRVEGSSLNLTGLTIKKLTLDKDGFSLLEGVKITAFWPTFIFEKEIDQVEIAKASLSSTLEEIYKKTLFQDLPIKKIVQIDAQKITLKELTWDIGTINKAYRLNVSASLVKEEGMSKLVAHVTAAQQSLRFDARLSGDISAEIVRIEGAIEDFDLKLKEFNVNRANGWFNYKNESEEEQLSSQIIASSGQFLSLPLQDIQLILGQDKNVYPVIFRAQAAGIKGVNLAVDTHVSVNISDQLFHTVLSIKDTPKFNEYLKAHKTSNDNIEQFFGGSGQSLIKMIYLPERRFAGGPYPMSFELLEDDNKLSTTGTVLLYPENFDVRGTIEGEVEKLKSIQSLFSLPKENLSESSLRLTGNAKDYLK